MGSGSGKELESEDTNTETQFEDTSQTNKSQPSQEVIQSAVQVIDDKKIRQIESIKSGSLSDSDNEANESNHNNAYENRQNIKTKPKSSGPRVSFAEIKEEEIADLNYIKPHSDELQKHNQLFLTHICHRGHFSCDSQWSAQNVLQNNEAQYMSLKSHNFDANYNKCDHDWFIFKINCLHSIKITQLSMDYSTANEIQQYPSRICMQFMLTKNLKRVMAYSSDNSRWSKPYYTKPSIFETRKPESKDEEHNDTFTVAFAAEYLDELYNNRYDQYVRISFIESHGNVDKQSKFCLKKLRLFGVPLLDDNNELIELEVNVQNKKQYKYEIENKSDSDLQPKPGKDDARILMREHVFFVNVGHKTVGVLKNVICEEYDRLNIGNENCTKFNTKAMFLIVDGYGFINDVMDSSVLNKTLSHIGAKQSKNNTGYYITVGFC